jgi:MOSC domain-containing protein YiiM
VSEQLIASLRSVSFTGPASVLGLIEKPGPGIHASRTTVQVQAGQGFTGDHNKKDFWKGERVPGREVTMFASEIARVVGADPLHVGDNVVSIGIDLSKLQAGDELRIGEVVLRRSEKDHRPCDLFARRVSQEAMLAVKESGTRGALFYVVSGGRLSVGDPITLESK